MAVSTPPPPHPPPPDSISTTSSSSSSITRSNFPSNPQPPHRPHQISPFFSSTTTSDYHIQLLPSNPNPNYPRLVPSTLPLHDSTAPTTASSTASILYPVASSGRGFIARQMALSNPSSNSNIYTTRHAVPSSSYSRPLFGHSHRDPALGQGAIYANGVGNPTHLQQAGVMGNSSVKGAAVSATFSQSQCKIARSPTPVSSFNGHKYLRERSKDDVFVTVHNRKVRASENASLYALCRSWLMNGPPEENKLQHLDSVRSLPKPLPLSAQDSTSTTIVKESEEVEKDEGSVEKLSEKELLQRHVKRAKRVRSRIREERLRRIAPYKTRLTHLLHPVVGSNFRNDCAIGEMK